VGHSELGLVSGGQRGLSKEMGVPRDLLYAPHASTSFAHEQFVFDFLSAMFHFPDKYISLSVIHRREFLDYVIFVVSVGHKHISLWTCKHLSLQTFNVETFS